MPRSEAAIARKNRRKRLKRAGLTEGSFVMRKPGESKGSPAYRRKMMMMFPSPVLTLKSEMAALYADAAANTAALPVEG
jgi:hypothetical protein